MAVDVLTLLTVIITGTVVLLAQSRRYAEAHPKKGAASVRPPGRLRAHRCAFGRWQLHPKPDSPYRHHLSLSFSASLASILSGAINGRVLAMELVMEKVGTLQRTATDTITEASRVNEELSDDIFRDRHR